MALLLYGARATTSLGDINDLGDGYQLAMTGKHILLSGKAPSHKEPISKGNIHQCRRSRQKEEKVVIGNRYPDSLLPTQVSVRSHRNAGKRGGRCGDAVEEPNHKEKLQFTH
jgi:hypothetical protein